MTEFSDAELVLRGMWPQRTAGRGSLAAWLAARDIVEAIQDLRRKRTE